MILTYGYMSKFKIIVKEKNYFLCPAYTFLNKKHWKFLLHIKISMT